jgi:hypothetical protein
VTRSELTSRFWAAAKFTRRCPERPQEIAQRVLIFIARHANGNLRQRALELIKDDNDVTGTSYTG